MNLVEYLLQVQSEGLNVETIYDIGANSGDWSVGLKNTVFPDSYFYLFEGNQDHEPTLQASWQFSYCSNDW